jgi:lysophospholipase L1-like esterase
VAEATKTKTKWTAARVAVVALTYAVAILLVEAAVRVTHPEAGRAVYPGYPAGLVVPDGLLGHAHQPGFNGFFPQPMYSDIPIAINAYGFRDPEWTADPDPARPRVLVLGDSITFGSPVRAEERYTDQAAKLLASRGRPIEFCNAGVNGYNVEQFDKLLRKLGPLLKPRLVLIGFCLRDAEPLAADDARLIRLDEQIAKGAAWARVEKFAAAYRLDLGQSYAWNLGRRLIEARLWSSSRFGPDMAARYTEKTRRHLLDVYNTGGLARLREHLAAMQKFAGDHWRAGLAVVIFAYHHQVKNQDPSLSLKVEGVLKELNIPFTNLYYAFLPHKDRDDLYAFQDDCHPSAFGHGVAGEATADFIAALPGVASVISVVENK